MANGDTKTESYLRVAAEGTRADLPSDTCCNTKTQNLILGVANRIMDVEDEVEEMKSNPDVADIVGTYADLQAYDKSKLTDKDIIRVLADETHNDDSTYYRYDKSTNTFTYIGESKQYTNFVGTDGTTAGTSGLVPAPATTDEGKYLKADGTWGTVQAGPTVVQTTGTSTTQVMSQNATTSMVYADPSAKKRIKMGASATIISDSTKVATSIGNRAKATGANSIAISGNKDYDATASGTTSIMIGRGSASNTGSVAIGMATASGQNSICISADNTTASGMYAVAIDGTVGGMGSVAIGVESSVATAAGSVALGACSSVTTKGTVGIGTTNTNYGYNSSNYRLLTGLYDPQNAHDAATKGYVDANAGSTIYLAYYPGSEPDPSDVRIYANAALTTELTGGDFWNILASGKPVVLRFNDTSQNEFYTFSLLHSHLPSENTASGFDGYPPEAYFSEGPSGSIIQIACTGGNPTSPFFGIYVINQ